MTNLKVLLVDDELGMRLGIKRILQNYHLTLPDFKEVIGFNIEVAEEGRQALEMIDSFKPDILLLDHKLPDMQGIDILIEVAKRKLDIKTIMITAFASLEVAISATKNGAFDFLAKPFTPDDLTSRLGKAARGIYLKRKARKLEDEKKQIRFQFISVLAHELKSPIAAVEGYLKIADQHMMGDSIEKYDHMFSRSITRLEGMKKLIADILDLTHIESGQRKQIIEKQNLIEVIKYCLDGIRVDAQNRNITIHQDVPEEISLPFDRSELEIILNNLFTNALKYNRDNGKIDIRVNKIREWITLEVTDTGIGMTKEEQERLFGEFVRIKNEKTKAIPGSGLGLSIMKKIVTSYGGIIKVSSQPDVGSTFTIRLKDNPESNKEKTGGNNE